MRLELDIDLDPQPPGVQVQVTLRHGAWDMTEKSARVAGYIECSSEVL